MLLGFLLGLVSSLLSRLGCVISGRGGSIGSGLGGVGHVGSGIGSSTRGSSCGVGCGICGGIGSSANRGVGGFGSLLGGGSCFIGSLAGGFGGIGSGLGSCISGFLCLFLTVVACCQPKGECRSQDDTDEVPGVPSSGSGESGIAQDCPPHWQNRRLQR